MIHIGFEVGTGEPVQIPETHTAIAGTTGTGKSELLRALIERTDSRILVLDVKRPRDYVGFGADVPLYIQQRMKPMHLKELLESTERISIKRELPELSRLCRKTSSWEGLLEYARERQANPKTRDFYKDVLEILIILFERLVEEFNQYQFAEKVVLANKVNVMDLSELSDQLQQVVVSSVLRYILRHHKDVILVVDEAHRFVPQARASAARHDVVRVIREGRANRIFVWLADQTVTGIDKQIMKQMQVWCLARQMELNEAERTVKQIPQRKSLGLTVEAVQTLGLGEFIIVTPKWARRTYVQPIWVTDDVARAVALGEVDVEILQPPRLQESEEEMVWKERAEKLAKNLDAERSKTKQQASRITSLEGRIKELERVLKARKPVTTPPPENPVPKPVALDAPIPVTPGQLTRVELVQLMDQRLRQLLPESPRVVQVPVVEAIHEKIRGSWMETMLVKLEKLTEAPRRAARIIREAGEIRHARLYELIRHRSGSDPSFSRDYIKPLINLRLITKGGKGGSIHYQWALPSLLEELFEGVLTDKEAKHLEEWVLSLLL